MPTTAPPARSNTSKAPGPLPEPPPDAPSLPQPPSLPSAEPPTFGSAEPEPEAEIPFRPYSPPDEPPQPQRVRVYFGTNREALMPVTPPIWLRVVQVSGAALLGLLFLQVVGALRKWTHRSLTWLGTASLLMALFVGWAGNPFAAYTQTVEHARGVVFGPRADLDGLTRYGHCDVTLPPVGNRRIGELPMKPPGWEDPDKHVILEQTALQVEETFFEEVRQKLAAIPSGERDVFVFVHGYNVDFRSAACRTAQLSVDLQFKGIPLFFSWPSKGALIGYTADVDEVQDSIVPIKKFLVRVAEDLKAEKVHVLAHSKGGAAVSFAIGQIDPGRKLFNQIILAAPDINANTFRRDIAPQMSKLALRSTLYCSQTDRALRGSMLFNSYKRAGDANDPIVIEPQLDTVDATGLDPSYLGHSYYGDSRKLIDDVRQLFGQNSAPGTRGLLEQRIGEKVYWMFKLGETETQ